MRTLFLILISWFVLASCNKEEDGMETNTYQILSLLINEFGKPIPPPPPPGEEYSLSKLQLDSINNQKQQIGIYPKFKKLDYERVNEELNKSINYQEDDYVQKQLNISKIETKSQYHLTIVDTVKLKQNRRYIEKNFDKLLSFHDIRYNNEYTKAETIIGVGMGPLNGFASLVILYKINGEWKIKETKLLQIS